MKPIPWLLLPSLLGGCVADAGDAARDPLPATLLAAPHLGELARTHRIADPDELVAGAAVIDARSSHVRIHHRHDGVPVVGSEAILHLDGAGDLLGVTDGLVPATVDVDLDRAIDATAAIEIAESELACTTCWTAAPRAELAIVQHGTRVAWRVHLVREDGTAATALPLVDVDAYTGLVLDTTDELRTATAPGTGIARYSGPVLFNTTPAAGTYYLEDTEQRLGVLDFGGTVGTPAPISDDDNAWNADQGVAVEAAFDLERVHAYFADVHGFTALESTGDTPAASDPSIALLAARVHYGSNLIFAAWDGTSITFGDGDGVEWGPMTTLDITGHELTHAVIAQTAYLGNTGETGALAEAIADIFGAMVELDATGAQTAGTWQIGEQAYTPGIAGDALRYLDDPGRNGLPTRYIDRYQGTSDSGGVHINCAIPEHAFYLLAMGDAQMTGIGTRAAEKIWFHALDRYMFSHTDFAGARVATLQAAAELYGAPSVEYGAVATSWSRVGIGIDLPPDNMVRNGGFELGFDGWSNVGASLGTRAQSGAASAVLQGGDSITQDVSYPPFPTSSLELTFYLQIGTANGSPWDKLLVSVNGHVLRTIRASPTGTREFVQIDAGAVSGGHLVFSAVGGGTRFRIDSVAIR